MGGKKEGPRKRGTGVIVTAPWGKIANFIISDADNYPCNIHVSPLSPHSQSGKFQYGNTMPRLGSHVWSLWLAIYLAPSDLDWSMSNLTEYRKIANGIDLLENATLSWFQKDPNNLFLEGFLPLFS